MGHKDLSLATRAAWEESKSRSVVSNRSLSHQDQRHIVLQFSGLAVNACSLLLDAGPGSETKLLNDLLKCWNCNLDVG